MTPSQLTAQSGIRRGKMIVFSIIGAFAVSVLVGLVLGCFIREGMGDDPSYEIPDHDRLGKAQSEAGSVQFHIGDNA